jgi:hypothetical protein
MLCPRPRYLLPALLAMFLLPAAAHAQQLSHRLILKDGSYQLVSKYEVKGDRVHYYSTEREDWEEVPSSLVDWPATEKYERNRASGTSVPDAADIDKEVEAEQKAEEAKTPQVATGLRLPDDGGVYMLETWQDQPELVMMQQSGGEVNKNMKGNIFRAAVNPLAGAKQTIELEGLHSKVQSHVTMPTFYVNASQQEDDESAPSQAQQAQQPQLPFDRFKIVRMQTKNDKRIVGDIKVAVYGKVSQDQKLVAANSRELTGGWVMITPTEALQPGEYAIVESLGKEGINLYVWDFGVNPAAAANQFVIKPDQKPTQSTEPEKPIELQKRPKN